MIVQAHVGKHVIGLAELGNIMLLKEFFGHNLDLKTHSSKKDDDKKTHDDLFWYILDHDKLHKDYFHPLAKKIKQAHDSGKADKGALVKEFLPMVNKGCKEYYTKKKLHGKLGKLFSKEVREELCERLYDHYCEDILKDKYKLG